MNCAEAQLELAVDPHSPPASVLGHLALCAECRRQRESLTNVVDLVQKPPLPVSEAWLASQRARVWRRLADTPPPTFRWAWVTGVAAAGFLTLWWARPDAPPPPSAGLVQNLEMAQHLDFLESWMEMDHETHS